jgi:hypothetical protein
MVEKPLDGFVSAHHGSEVQGGTSTPRGNSHLRWSSSRVEMQKVESKIQLLRRIPKVLQIVNGIDVRSMGHSQLQSRYVASGCGPQHCPRRPRINVGLIEYSVEQPVVAATSGCKSCQGMSLIAARQTGHNQAEQFGGQTPK